MPARPLSVHISLKQPFGGAFGRRAVIAEDVVDQRVVERPEILDRVDEATDFVVGLLEEPGVDLHLARQHRLELRGHVVPTPGSHHAATVSSASLGTTPSSFCLAMIRSRSTSQPSSNLPLYLSDHSLGT